MMDASNGIIYKHVYMYELAQSVVTESEVMEKSLQNLGPKVMRPSTKQMP